MAIFLFISQNLFYKLNSFTCAKGLAKYDYIHRTGTLLYLLHDGNARNSNYGCVCILVTLLYLYLRFQSPFSLRKDSISIKIAHIVSLFTINAYYLMRLIIICIFLGTILTNRLVYLIVFHTKLYYGSVFACILSAPLLPSAILCVAIFFLFL